MVNKRLINTGAEAAPAGLDPLQNFETVTYTGNGSTQKITGYIRKGAAFNGSSSYIDLGSSALKQLPMTISLWLNPVTNANATFYSNLSSSTEGFYCRVQSDGSFLIDAYNGGSNRTLLNNTTGSIPDNTWSHVAITFDSSNVILYINGSETDRVSTNANGIAFTASEPTKLGVRGTSSDWYNGKIDQVRIFNTALNPTQVGQLALEDYTDPKKSTTDYFGNGSGVSLYELDEDANDTGVPIDSGQSAVFDGSTSKVALSGSTSLTNRTISMWFNPSKSTNLTLLDNTQGKVNGAKQFGRWNMLFNYGGLNYAVWNEYNGSQYGAATFSYTFQVGTWYHVAFCVESGNNAVYINGVSQTLTVTRGTSIGTVNLADCTLGFDRDISSLCYDGKLDQVRIYSSALSASDVQALVSETNVPTANLVAHYKLDGNANDETTNYNGTWGGTEAYSDPAVIAYNGTPTNVNFLGMAFQPDLVWVKRRDSGIGGTNHLLFDSVRGAGERLSSDNANQEYTLTDEVTSFDSNGFTVGADASANGSGGSIVAWCWKAGGNSNTFNVDGIGYSSASAAGLATGTNNPTGASVNTKSGFSIIKLNSGSVANSDRTVAHGLGVKPSFVLFRRTSLSAWFTWSAGLSPESYYLYLQESYGVNDLTQSSNAWGNQSFTDTTISWRNSWTFSPNEELIAYVWADIPGYQKSGSYTGNDSSKRIYTDSNADGTGTGGFAPRFLLIKCSSNGGTNKEWNIFDTTRDPSPINKRLEANTSDSEFIDTSNITINSDGFTLGDNGTATGSINQVGFDYIYLAIA